MLVKVEKVEYKILRADEVPSIQLGEVGMRESMLERMAEKWYNALGEEGWRLCHQTANGSHLIFYRILKKVD